MKIAAYCRVSTDKQEQAESLRHQKEFFTEFARRNGHELVGLYADEGISGTSLKKREAFKRLLLDAETGLFRLVVVKDISRFARNTVDALQSVRKLKALGISTVFLTANMDSMGVGEFLLTLFSAMAQEESHNLSKRVKWGEKINAEKGRVPHRVFGYDKLDNFTLAPNDGEARTVRKIFSLYVEGGLGCRTISMELNRAGDRTKMGGEWNARGVRRVLGNPLYCRKLVNHKYEIEDFLTGKQVSIPQEEQFVHRRPEWAIVSPEQFQRAQEMYADDLISMRELKEKLNAISQELNGLQTEREAIARTADLESMLPLRRRENSRFLDFETVTNADLRRLVDHISVNKDGTVRVILKRLDEAD